MSEPIRDELRRGVVHLDGIPASLEARLGDLYESTYSLPAYFRIFYPNRLRRAWELRDPAHLIEFDVQGSAAVVLNGLFPIDSSSLESFCKCVFDALPNVDRIRFGNLTCDPADLGLAFRVDRMVDDTVVGLPSTREEYLQALGPSTRRNVRRYVRRLEQAYPSYRFELFEQVQIPDSILAGIIGLNREHWQMRGEVSGIDEAYEARLTRLSRECGLTGALSVNDTLVAGWLGTRVGRNCFLHVTGYSSAFERLRPGLVSCFFTIGACIDRGIRNVHFLWGCSAYKLRLGGTVDDVYFVTVFRRASARYRHPREEAAFRGARARARLAPLLALPGRATRKAARLLHPPIERPPEGEE